MWYDIIKSGPVDVDEWREHIKEQELESTPPFSDTMLGRAMSNMASEIWDAKIKLDGKFNKEDKREYEILMRKWMTKAIQLNKGIDMVARKGEEWTANSQLIEMEDELVEISNQLQEIEKQYGIGKHKEFDLDV